MHRGGGMAVQFVSTTAPSGVNAVLTAALDVPTLQAADASDAQHRTHPGPVSAATIRKGAYMYM